MHGKKIVKEVEETSKPLFRKMTREGAQKPKKPGVVIVNEQEFEIELLEEKYKSKLPSF